MNDFYRVDTTVRTLMVRLNIFVAHDPARDRRYESLDILRVYFPVTLGTVDHGTFSLSVRVIVCLQDDSESGA